MRSIDRDSDIWIKTVWLMVFFLIFVSPALVLTGCATAKKQESAGQYMDDTAITAKVKAALLNESSLKAAPINVETYQGVVQLSGFVGSEDDARMAGNVAAGIPDVVSVKNDLIVK